MYLLFLLLQLWCVPCSLHHRMGPSAAPWVALLVACAHLPVMPDSLWLVLLVASAVHPLSGQAHSHFVGHYSVFLWNPLKMESLWLHVTVTTHQPAQCCVLLGTHLRGLEYKHAFLILGVVKYTGLNNLRVLVSFTTSYIRCSKQFIVQIHPPWSMVNCVPQASIKLKQSYG